MLVGQAVQVGQQVVQLADSAAGVEIVVHVRVELGQCDELIDHQRVPH